MNIRKEWELTKNAYYKAKIAKLKYKLSKTERKLYWSRKPQS